jgi:hypothetical protein
MLIPEKNVKEKSADVPYGVQREKTTSQLAIRVRSYATADFQSVNASTTMFQLSFHTLSEDKRGKSGNSGRARTSSSSYIPYGYCNCTVQY